MIKTEPTVWDQYKRETNDILEELVDVHKKDFFKDLVIEEITSEIISGKLQVKAIFGTNIYRTK